jgi:hypothetical protein
MFQGYEGIQLAAKSGASLGLRKSASMRLRVLEKMLIDFGSTYFPSQF